MVIFWILCVLFASVVAGNKGHDGCMWALEGTNQTKVLTFTRMYRYCDLKWGGENGHFQNR
ncbi:hypothetical protein BCV64_02825 [Cylindrospermopsis raciborskii MVCC14]|nr:hypothetical protein BCV64_02825 [Cylindrospermopsis raciborskii MVCC14]